jgi:hypothetical protein
VWNPVYRSGFEAITKPKGRRIITALIAACNADVEQLTKMAA